MPIEPNAWVTARYVLRTKAGEVLDDGSEPLEYVHGYGTLVPGLEANLLDMREGEKKTIELEPFEAFGERDEELVFSVGRDELPEGTNVGDELVIEGPDGGQFEVRVRKLDPEQAELDANHPLAGLVVVFEVEVLAIRDATESEIRAATGDGGEGIVQLGRKHSKPLG
jgi:FKBP-type peptidyl-prolyl cis-trans isomerase SlyD